MHAREFAFAVARHLSRLIGSDESQRLVREHSVELDRTVSSSVLRFSLLRVAFSIDPADDLVPRLVSSALSPSARHTAQLLVELAWVRGGRMKEDVRLAIVIQDVEHLFRMLINGLRSSEPFATRHAAVRPTIISPIVIIDDGEPDDPFASPRKSSMN